MYPVINYLGRDVEVTPDTAAELVGRGLASLVSGDMPEWPPKPAAKSVPVVEDVPEVVEDVPAVKTAKPKAKAKSRRKKKE